MTFAVCFGYITWNSAINTGCRWDTEPVLRMWYQGKGQLIRTGVLVELLRVRVMSEVSLNVLYHTNAMMAGSSFFLF